MLAHQVRRKLTSISHLSVSQSFKGVYNIMRAMLAQQVRRKLISISHLSVSQSFKGVYNIMRGTDRGPRGYAGSAGAQKIYK